jgi:CMP-N-acetylneuraminic acid synthetase
MPFSLNIYWKIGMKNNVSEVVMLINALLTGRGNNTLKDKNILSVLEKPVLYYIANSAKKCCEIHDFYCSSDDEKILNIAETIGYKKIKRPSEYALANSQHIDCIIHALGIMEHSGSKPDILVVLLANNVTIKSQWITDCILKMKNDLSITAVVPVYLDNDHHPLRAKIMNSDGTLSMYEKGKGGKVSTNRQDLTPCYYLAHNFWVINIKNIYSQEAGQPPWEFMGNRIMAYPIDESIDIHTERDLLVAKEWIKKNYGD